MDGSGKRATGIVYMDANGKSGSSRPSLSSISAFIFENVRLMLLSGVGTPYDPVTNTGTTGRNYAYQTANSVRMFFDDKNFNPFIGGGAIGMGIDEFNNDNFDHSGLGFVGGGSTRVTPIGAAPIDYRALLPPGTPLWGSEWKKGHGQELRQRPCRSAARRAAMRRAPTTFRWTRPIRIRWVARCCASPSTSRRTTARWPQYCHRQGRRASPRA
jgi:hypothetical protein